MPVCNRVAHYGLRNFARCKADAAYPRLWDGLMGLWSPHVNPPGGTTLYDWSGMANHGATSGIDAATFWTQSEGGRANLYDASDDLASLGSPAHLNLTGEMSISVWFRLSSTAGSQAAIASFNSGGGLTNWAFTTSGAGATRKLGWWHDGGGALVAGTTTLSASQWYHAVAVRSGAAGAWTIQYHLDGASDGSGTTATNPGGGTYPVAIGRLGGFAGYYFPGHIGDVGIWNRVLSAQESRMIYSLGRGGLFTPRRRAMTSVQVDGGPFPHYLRRSNCLTGGMIGMGG